MAALHRYLRLTPSRLLGVALADAVGDRRTQNQPGTIDEYPNWRVPLAGPDGGRCCWRRWSPTSARSGSPPSCRAATDLAAVPVGYVEDRPESRRKDREKSPSHPLRVSDV